MRTQVITSALLFLGTMVLVVFNNCSQVNFQRSEASIAAEIAMFSVSSSIVIDGGAPYTNQNTLELTLSSPRATSMKLSTQADCSDGSWEPFVTSKVQNVTTPNQKINVYGQFKDITGNISDCAVAAIVHDNQPPTAVFTTAANQYVNSASMNVAWTASDSLSGVSQVTCFDNSGASSSCGSQLFASNKTEGTNTISIIVTDKAGNVSPKYPFNWYYDKTPPTVVINSQPAAVTGSTAAAFTFTGADSGSGVASYTCSIDQAAPVACTSPVNYSLGSGAHHFEVVSIDKAGNKSTAAKADWIIDLAAPTLMFTQTPGLLTNSTQATFAYTATDGGATISNFQCALDGAALAICSNTKVFTGLVDGSHTFQVIAIDLVGNKSSPLIYKWTIDTVAPVVQITQSPSSPTNSQTANFTWKVSDNSNVIASVQCGIDGALTNCPNLASTFASLPAGPHTFTVKAVDGAGNTGSASVTWTIDLTPPVVTITSGPTGYTSPASAGTSVIYTAATNATFVFSATDNSGANGIKMLECALDAGAYGACTSPDSLTALAEGGHVFYVRATDQAGNTGTANYSWSIDLSPPLITHSATTSLLSGSPETVQYKAVDPGSGLASVLCGLITTPSGTNMSALTSCQNSNTVSLGTLNDAGSYVFEIQATDNVGNVSVDTVNITVTARPLVCDPFSTGTAGTLCSGGLVGDIYYLTGSVQTSFVNQAPAKKTVDYFYQYGTKSPALLNLNSLNVPERAFSQGFPVQGGSALVDSSGHLLMQYFAFHLNTIVKLDPAIDLPGYYQIATISDDGSIVNYQASASAPSQNLISSDGDHSARLGCSVQTIYISDTSRLPMEVKYYQGPATDIALMMLWRRVDSTMTAQDTLCGVTDRTGFFGPNYGDLSDTYYFGQLIDRGWKVMSPTNFIAPASNVNTTPTN